MSQKRRDNRGRILKENEYQRSDGKYEYRYEVAGQRISVYSWRLVSTDWTPVGKREDLPLREKVKTIMRDLEDGINTYQAAKMTFNELVMIYLDSKTKIKERSRRKSTTPTGLLMRWSDISTIHQETTSAST